MSHEQRTATIDDRERLATRALTIALRTATALIHDRERARDVAQDVAVIALTKHGQLRDAVRFDQWVHRITVRECSRAMRIDARRRQERPLDDEDPLLGTAEPDDVTRLTALQALEELPERERMALTLRYVHDLSEKQIAKAMGCRKGTVGSLLSRGRKRLRSSPEMKTLFPTASGGLS